MRSDSRHLCNTVRKECLRWMLTCPTATVTAEVSRGPSSDGSTDELSKADRGAGLQGLEVTSNQKESMSRQLKTRIVRSGWGGVCLNGGGGGKLSEVKGWRAFSQKLQQHVDSWDRIRNTCSMWRHTKPSSFLVWDAATAEMLEFHVQVIARVTTLQLWCARGHTFRIVPGNLRKIQGEDSN